MLPDPPSILQISYLYAPEDEKLVKRFEKHLSPLKKQTIIANWTGCKATSQEIHYHERRLLGSGYDLYLLLLSPDFMSAPFDAIRWYKANRSNRSYLSETAKAIPILLRPVLWHVTDLYILEALPRNKKPVTSWNNRDEAFLDIMLGIAETVKDLIPTVYREYIKEYLLEAAYAKGKTSYARLTDEEEAACRSEADELFQKALDVMKNINLEITQNAYQISSEISTQPANIQSLPTILPPSHPQTTRHNKVGIDDEEKEEPIK